MQTTDEALFRIQRDIRQSDPNGVFVCSSGSPPATCTLGSALATATQTNYLAILTAASGGNGLINWDDSGRPAWTGFQVYWLVPSASGTGNDLRYCFAPASIQPGTSPVILNADVVAAVAAATASASAATVARSVSTMQTVVNVSKDSVAVRIQSVATESASTNSTSVQGDTYARN